MDSYHHHINGNHNNKEDVIVGTAECSVHEFEGTELGRRRLERSILYVTEVAVNPSFRRCGVGSMLLRGMDELAALRKVETLYLHVDVTNVAALALYAKFGYTVVDSQDPMYEEFTRSLNLHDGATCGRNHYLLYKHLSPNITWRKSEEESVVQQKHGASTTTMKSSTMEVSAQQRG